MRICWWPATFCITVDATRIDFYMHTHMGLSIFQEDVLLLWDVAVLTGGCHCLLFDIPGYCGAEWNAHCVYTEPLGSLTRQ